MDQVRSELIWMHLGTRFRDKSCHNNIISIHFYYIKDNVNLVQLVIQFLYINKQPRILCDLICYDTVFIKILKYHSLNRIFYLPLLPVFLMPINLKNQFSAGIEGIYYYGE